MRARLIGAIVIGIAGTAILVSLGNWQVRRLHWKLGVLEQIESRIDGPVADLPAVPDPERDEYLPVAVTGRFQGQPLRVQSAMEGQGAGYRIIQGFDAPSGPLLIDRGFLSQGRPLPPTPDGEVTVTGNLLWPDEQDGFTPDPDLEEGLFYARDLPRMAEVLETRPLLVVRREGPGGGGDLVAFPVGTSGIRNDHKGYAVTWYSLAAVWLVMSGFLIYRMSKQSKGKVT